MARPILQHIRRLIAIETASQASDAALLERFVAQRDESAFALLLKRHGPMVLRLARRLVGQEQDAEDIFQATFLLFARKAGSIRKRQSVGSWLYGVAYRLAGRVREQKAHRKAHERQAATMHGANPQAAAAWLDLQELLEDVLAQLPEKYRTPLILCYLEGKTQEQVAQQLGCPLGTVRSWLARGRGLLRRRLARRGVSLSSGAIATALVAEAVHGAAADLPPALLQTTLKAALRFVAGQESVGLVSAQVVALVKGGLSAMMMAKIKGVTTLLIALTALVLGSGMVTERVIEAKQRALVSSTESATAADRSAAPEPQQEAQTRTDTYGDPLPPTAIRRVGTLRFRKEGRVNGLLLTPDGKTLVSSSDNYGQPAVCVWEMPSGRRLRQFPGDKNDMASWIALSPDGKMVAVSRGTEVDLWDLASGERVQILKGEKVEYRFAGLAFAPDGKTLAAGDQGGIHFWDLPTGKPSGRLPTQGQKGRITLLTYSPDGKLLASASDFGGRLIQLWDVASRTLVHEWTRSSNVYSIAFSPDSSTLTAGAQDGIIPLWDVKTGEQMRAVYGAYDVRAVGFSRDGKILATGEYDNKQSHPVIGLWDAATGKELRRIEGHFHRIESLVFSADGKTVITSGTDNIIRLWDVATGTERTPQGNQGYVGHVTVSPDGRTLAYATHESIRLLNLATGEEIGSLPSVPALSLAYSPDGTMLACGTHANAIFLWDVGTRKLRAKLKGDAKFDGFANGFFNSVAFTPDSKVLISGGNDAAVRFWDVATGTELRRLSLKDEANRDCYVSTIALSPDGRLLAASGWAQQGNPGGITRLWETATGRELPHLTLGINDRSGEQPRFLSWNWMGILHQRIVFSPDGKMFATNRLDKTIAVWETASGKQRCLLQGHQQATLYLTFSPDSRVLASADLDNTIRLWDLETGKELRPLTGHRGKVNSLVFSVDGTILVSAASDTTLLFWDLSGDRQALRLRPRPRSSQEPETLWSSLADSDAARAYQAIKALREMPGQTVPLLQRHLQPARTPDSRQIARLMDDLDSPQFEVRQKATAELKRLGDLAEPALRGKLLQPLSPEARQRIEQLLEQATVIGPEGLRVLRAVEVLEQIGTPEARQLLNTLAKGAPDSLLTREAAASGRRLLKRPAD